nr:MAG TPA: hypothetical protein [Caudoviricetes sp.]
MTKQAQDSRHRPKVNRIGGFVQVNHIFSLSVAKYA